MNKKIIATLTALVLAGSLAGCASDFTPARDDSSRPSSNAAAGETPTPATPEEEEPVAEPADDEGSRTNPFAYGDTATASDVTGDVWDVIIGQPTDVTAAIAQENQFNDAPAEGNVYIGVPVTATYLGEDVGTMWLDLDVAFVTDDGRTFEETFVVQPWPSLMDIADLYQGGTGEATVVIEVPAATAGLTRLTFGYTATAFFGGAQ